MGNGDAWNRKLCPPLKAGVIKMSEHRANTLANTDLQMYP